MTMTMMTGKCVCEESSQWLTDGEENAQHVSSFSFLVGKFSLCLCKNSRNLQKFGVWDFVKNKKMILIVFRFKFLIPSSFDFIWLIEAISFLQNYYF